MPCHYAGRRIGFARLSDVIDQLDINSVSCARGHRCREYHRIRSCHAIGNPQQRAERAATCARLAAPAIRRCRSPRCVAHDQKCTLQNAVRSGEDSAWLPGIGPTSDVSHPTETLGDSSHDGHSSDGGGHSN